MKIAAYTSGGINNGPARLRSFYLFGSADKFSLSVSRPSRFRDALHCDVVHIQQFLTYKMFFAIVIYRILGIKVVYDMADQPSKLVHFIGFFTALLLSSVVTVNTETRRDYWKKFIFFKKIVVINDVADFNDVNLYIKKRGKENLQDTNGFFWIGYSQNFGSLSGFVKLFENAPRLKLTVATEKEAITSLSDKYPFVRFLPWFDGIAYSNDINAKFMILNHINHDLYDVSLLKSDNKMVLAILAGFVPIVSRTPSYEKLAKSLNAEFLLFDNIEEVEEIAANLKETNLDDFFNKAFDFINLNYSRDVVLSDFIKKVI